MIITRVNNCKAVAFENAEQGNLISYDGNLYMKIPTVTEDTYHVNAVNLETGALRTILSNTLVLLVEDYEFKYSV